MKRHIFLVAVLAAFTLTGCTKTATVENEQSGKLTLTEPAAVTLHRGGMTKTEIKISRESIVGDVTIRFTHLPDGVDVVESGSKIVGSAGSYTLRASDTADLVENFSANVTATGGPGNISVSTPITISVREKL